MISRDNYIKIFENGERHIEVAKNLAIQDNHGFAISHLILGIEELIKYQIIYAYFTEENIFTQKEIEEVFINHKAKHSLIKEFQKSISEEISKIWHDYILKKATNQNIDSEIDMLKNHRFCGIGSFLQTAYKEILLTDSERKDFIDFLDKANNFKNDGLYVDYKNNKWKFPTDLTSNDYQKAFFFADIILKQTTVIKDLDITDDEFIKIMNSEM